MAVVINGDAGNNTLTGTAADDTIYASTRDQVYAGPGNDRVILA